MADKKTHRSRLRGNARKKAKDTRVPEKTAAWSETAGQAEVQSPVERPEVVVAGIGASAGGLAALKDFFANVAEDSGLAYVVVVHLSPERESHLAGLLQTNIKMPVLQVNETVELKPNCVFVIPPNANLSAIDTHLRLSALEERRAERAPIDHFFRTLAATHNGHAIGVVLTGTGSDGTLGIKEIKLRGGLTVVQDPNEAEFDGMPQSAIATGFVDLVLPVARIPEAVVRFAHTEPQLPRAVDGEQLEADHRILLQKVFSQIRARTGRDFTRYKRSTVMRRIRRRMQLCYIEELERYVNFLRQSADEVRALADDLLITVSSFFRDPAVFEQIERVLVPELFDGKGPDDEIRLWCVGCATGEEVYSVAMLLIEHAAKLEGLAPRLHIFASDLHERSLDIAREGFYPGDIGIDVSAERLKRFFTQETGGYRIRKDVRELIVFTSHNLLADPPFSRMDLIVCRNLLIYLQREVQSDVFRLFRYALRPGGYLVLGPSETVDDAELFRALDKPHSVYRRGHAPVPEPRTLVFPIIRHEPAPTQASAHAAQPHQYEIMHRALVQLYAPPSALVGPDSQLVHLSERAGRYFEHPGGRLSVSAAKLIRKELTAELIAALHAVRRDKRPVRTSPVPVRFNGESRTVVLQVRPATEAASDGYNLVLFEEQEPAPQQAEPAPRVKGEALASELTAELHLTRQRLQSIIEEFESTQEEMKAANEELQSTNEELRSTMEELETSKEELQSTNEELHTVNQENRHKVEELASLSGDLQNLLTSTDIATLFLDRELRILRFTPRVEKIFNMRQTDHGRPVSDLTHKLGYPELRSDAESVLRRLTPMERELEDKAGRWYLTNLLPYRSVDDRIQGVVITFVDITRRKKAEDEIIQLTRTLEQRVAERTRQVRDLSTSLVRAEQRERRRLSETLHDELQQLLYGVQLKLNTARSEMSAGRTAEAEQPLRQAEALLQDSTRVTRQLSVDLNPPILRHEGLRAILTWLQSHMRELHGLEVELDVDGEVRIDDGDVRVLLFQVFRELLFNVAKHAEAGRAKVTLREIDGELHVGVADDGKGFDAGRAMNREKSTIGLTSVKERIGLLGGRMEIQSSAGDGTVISVVLPKSARIGA